ncbi:MAG: DUF2961 domain-containing protein [Clostridiales bacterium]|nr:DUF2961 domain-containing protein [Clostridiales bacterium]
MLRDLYRERKGKRKRESSYDRTGGNFDFYGFNPGDKKVIFDVNAPGCITHIWVTMAAYLGGADAMLERKVVLRMYWDNEEEPSVEAPIGDFFGMGHGISKNFVSAPLTMCPQDGRGYNCYFPMPYSDAARIEVENQSEFQMLFYFYVDYEEYDEAPDSSLRFHASWRRELTESAADPDWDGEYFQFAGENLTGEENYVILEARGKGHYVGCNMNIHNLRYTNQNNWPGEGDDMIFIDDEPWPPRLHGTGCEDYFNTAFCPTEEYNAPYNGIILPGGPNWYGKITYYRYHILDPIMFDKSIKVTIEHGHNNNRYDDYSSTAYWYQTEPHIHYPILPVAERIPLPDIERDLPAMVKMKAQRDIKAKEMGLEE